MLRFQNYSKGYGKTEIIAIPDLNLDTGIYWLRGENGSGKTTMIKSIAGLAPFEGSIEINGKNIKQDRKGYTSIVNYAEAEPLYPGFLTGNDLVSFYEETKKAPKSQAVELSAKLGITGYSPNKVATYSSGMAKKLSLVLAFMGKPGLILLDEPLITLDAASVNVLQQLIQQYHDAGVSFIITSHQEITLGTHPVSRLQIRNKTLAAI